MRKFVSVGEDRYHILAEVPITSNINLEALKKSQILPGLLINR